MKSLLALPRLFFCLGAGGVQEKVPESQVKGCSIYSLAIQILLTNLVFQQLEK